MNHRERLKHLLVERSLELGEFTLASGARSSYYVDARRTTMTAEGQFLVGRVGVEALDEHGLQPLRVGGLTMGADPIAFAIAHASWRQGAPIDAFSVRKSAKAHGSGRRVEGGLAEGSSVLVVEDTLTTGASALSAIEALEQLDCDVLGVLTLVDREEGGRERLAGRGYALYPLFRAGELLEVADAPESA